MVVIKGALSNVRRFLMPYYCPAITVRACLISGRSVSPLAATLRSSA